MSKLKELLKKLIRLITGKGNKVEDVQEKKKRLVSFISELYPEEPFVLDGKWSWSVNTVGVIEPIDIVLPDLPLAVVLEKESTNKTQKEYFSIANSDLKQRFEFLGIPYLYFDVNDPITKESVDNRLAEMIRNWK